MKLICSFCGRDLNQIWQDNMSCTIGTVKCEDCANGKVVHNHNYEEDDYYDGGCECGYCCPSGHGCRE